MSRAPFLAFAVLLASLLAIGPATAHPHVFIDATHALIFDEKGRLAAIRSTWVYDDLFTLLMVEDGGYDRNDDGDISASELADMQLWDANWPDDYFGDLEIEMDGRKLALEEPTDWAADWRDGRAVSIHTRKLVEPVEMTSELVLRAYDPFFYVAYTIADLPRYVGRADCRAVHIMPNDDAVSPEIAAAVAALPPDQTPEEAGLPSIGRLWAEELHVTCGA